MITNYNISIISDEISDNLDEVVDFLKYYKISLVELRTVEKKNLLDYTKKEVDDFYHLLKVNNISVSALASPLFKWFPTNTNMDEKSKVDTYFFSPHLSNEQKLHYIKKSLTVARSIKTNKVRIFSSLMTELKNNYKFEKDPLFKFAITQAQKFGINLLLENEPPCYLHYMIDIKKFIKKYGNKYLGLWFDISNFYLMGDKVTKTDIIELKKYIHYFHLKDFDAATKNYVPFGEGSINYQRIIPEIIKNLTNKNYVFSLETHAKKNRQAMVAKSIENLRSIIWINQK